MMNIEIILCIGKTVRSKWFKGKYFSCRMFALLSCTVLTYLFNQWDDKKLWLQVYYTPLSASKYAANAPKPLWHSLGENKI